MRYFLLVLVTITISLTAAATVRIDSLKYGNFGWIKLYSSDKSNELVLFISGDGGWNAGVVSMAKNIATKNAMVAGIDIRHYFAVLHTEKNDCYYPASDFEDLSLALQKKYHFQNYIKPILVGYSSGATLVYGMLVQAPANTFKGGIALGFCPDLKTGKPLCKGSGLTYHNLPQPGNFYLEKYNSLTAPFIVLNGYADQVCNYDATKTFLAGMHNAQLILLNKVGHGFSVPGNWMPQFLTAFKEIVNAPSYSQTVQQKNYENQEIINQRTPGDLPLTVIPSAIKSDAPLMFMISGDGGWTSFDQSFAEQLSQRGITVIGLDAQKYFWNEKKPDQTTADLSKAIEFYLQQFGKKNFVLAGYSFGASIVPFIASRLNNDLKAKLKTVVSISPDVTADFEIHVSDMLGFRKNKEKYDVLAEEKKIAAFNPVCFFGEKENHSTTNAFKNEGIKIIMLPGNHHYDDNYSLMATKLAEDLNIK